jgi:GNAT superfamily N-acetyltransferase
MSEIRALQFYEVPLLLPQAREFFKEGGICGELNDAHFTATLTKSLEARQAIVLVSGAPFRGAIAGVMFQDLATADWCCMEYFWYVAKEERGTLGLRLLDAFEKEAKSRGAVRIVMMHLENERAGKMQQLYERRGYKLREQIFVREV